MWMSDGGEGVRFGMLLRHDDAEREFVYDRYSASGRLDSRFAGGRKRRVDVGEYEERLE